MAITVQQYPYIPNVSNTALVLEVTSNQITQPQFQYVVDLKDYNGNLIQRVKQQPNPSGKGVFELGQIISQQFSNDYTFVTASNDTSNIGKSIPTTRPIFFVKNGGMLEVANVYIGEEYGTTVSSTAIMYDGNGNVGDPAVTFTDDLQMYLKGVLDWNVYNSTPNNSSVSQYTNTWVDKLEGKLNPEIVWGDRIYSSSVLFNYDGALTDYTNITVGPNDYYTLSFLLGSSKKTSNIEEWEYTKAQWIYDGITRFYTKDGVEINTRNFGGARDIFNDGTSARYWYKAQHSQSLNDRLQHSGVGPQNYTNYYPTQIVTPSDDPVNYTSYYTVEYRAYKDMMANTYTVSPYTGSNPSSGELGTQWLPNYGTMILLDGTQTGITGSYPSSPAYITVRGSVGPAVDVHFSQSDALLLDYPIASGIQVVNTINEQCEAAGSSVRAFYSYEPLTVAGFNYDAGTPEENKLRLILLDYRPTTIANFTNLTVSNSGSDGFGEQVVGQNSALGITIGDFTYTNDSDNSGEGDVFSTYGNYTFTIDWDVENCGYETKQFAWRNTYGVLDYYTFTLAQSTTDNITRNQYTKTVIDYNTTSNTVEHNVEDYGRKQFTNIVDQTHTIESNWLDDENASRIKEMFYSTNVFIVNPDTLEMDPVVITNTSIEEKTNPRTQKLYKLTAEYKYANNLRERV